MLFAFIIAAALENQKDNSVKIGIGVVAATILFFTLLILFYYVRSKVNQPKLPLLEIRAILNKYFLYYRLLSAEKKKLFEERTIWFIQHKNFIPRNFAAITLEMKTLVAATATQITFGLPKVSLEHFEHIIIYPDDYISIITKQYHQGEVNPQAKAIVLSWHNFIKGFADPNDSINLGLHEMAHALELENVIENKDFQFFNRNTLQEWDKSIEPVIENIKIGGNTFFRPYAATNKREFFAVAVEYFFEQPQLFSTQFPELYQLLSKLLNQDPVALGLTDHDVLLQK